MALSKKHYVAVARFIKDRRQFHDRAMTSGYVSGFHAGVEALAWDLAGYFAAENPEFSRVRFLDACGIGVDPNSTTGQAYAKGRIR